MSKLLVLPLLVAAATAAAQPAAMSWGADEPTHRLLLRQNLAGEALGAVEGVLAAEGFHVTRTHLVMTGTAVPTLRQGTLTIGYETTVQQPVCARGAPCIHVAPAQVIVQLACDQYVVAGRTVADSCDGLRGISVTPQH